MVFIFIGRGGRTPSKSGYKRTLQLRSNLIRITQDQIGLTGRPDRSDRSAFGNANFGCQHMPPLLFSELCKLKSKYQKLA